MGSAASALGGGLNGTCTPPHGPAPRRRPRQETGHHGDGDPAEQPRRGLDATLNEPPPPAAVTAARSRGDCVQLKHQGSQVVLCLCKRRRLEHLEGPPGATVLRWRRAVQSLVVCVPEESKVVLRCNDLNADIAEIPERGLPLLRLLARLQRLAVRAAVPHSLWPAVDRAGITQDGAQVVATRCLECGELLAEAPTFCPVTGAIHSQFGWTPEDHEGAAQLARAVAQEQGQNLSGRPPDEEMREAVSRDDWVEYAVEGGSRHRLVYVRSGRLEKYVNGEWDRPVSSLEVPHVGSRALRDTHLTVVSGCLLPPASCQDVLSRVAQLADRAQVPHNLWDHVRRGSDAGPPQAGQRFRAQRPPSVSDSQMLHQGEATSMRVRRRLSGPSEGATTPASRPARSPPFPVERMINSPGGPGDSGPSRTPERPPFDDAAELGGSVLVLPAAAIPFCGNHSSCSVGDHPDPQAEDVGDDCLVNGWKHGIAEECCVCLEEQKNTVLMPCRHLCVCSHCAQVLTHCPLCRFDVCHRLEVWV
eukprot:TRINITY_DN55070_c0_g1_i1.p2 TRINITY_DN55070_c0_g1~~TRINITY_DN55070_c0_g1_i1.p2  ORF type:complete len:531 (+),score=117.10 TRINITY_DN55070_c0_g1_i1:80-1672(+)